MTLKVGAKGFDSGNPLEPKVAAANGSRFQMRYSAGVGSSNLSTAWKLTRPNEIKQILDSGQFFGANSEWYEDRCTEGAKAGREDGLADLDFWQSRGLEKGKSIYISWDTAASPSLFSALAAYVEAYNHALNGYYHADGLYAGIPALIWMSNHSLTRHGWIPSAAGWSSDNKPIDPRLAPPANSVWDLWFPTPDQVVPAIEYINEKLLAGHKLESCAWQCGGQAMGGNADVNFVNIGGYFGFMGEENPAPHFPPRPHLPTPHPHQPEHPHQPQHHRKLYQGASVPHIIAKGTGHYLGLITGPKESHGGFHKGERNIIRMLQQRLIVCGFVPGHIPHSGWADGKFGKSTAEAVTRFQKKHMPHTKFYGQVWWDDWHTLFNL